jgi:hypothetical protein
LGTAVAWKYRNRGIAGRAGQWGLEEKSKGSLQVRDPRRRPNYAPNKSFGDADWTAAGVSTLLDADDDLKNQG